MILCACVVGQTNAPLYVANFLPEAAPRDEALRLQTIVHCALDAVEERVAGGSGAGALSEPYLGALHAVDDVRVYCYLTNSRTKLLLAADGPPSAAKEDELRGIFRRLHTAYVEAVSNPFYTPGAPLDSPRFDASTRTICSSLGAMG